MSEPKNITPDCEYIGPGPLAWLVPSILIIAVAWDVVGWVASLLGSFVA